MTYFRTGKSVLSSARHRFTVLFGMGRRGASGLWSSGIDRRSATGVVTDHPCRPIEEEVKLGLDRRKHRNQLHAVHMVMGSSRTGY